MRYQRPFRDVIPRSKAGHPRVTHPFATLLIPCGTFAFDLHVLGTPPALILSQDQTLKLNSLSPLPALRPRAERNSFNPISLLKMALGFIPTKSADATEAARRQDGAVQVWMGLCARRRRPPADTRRAVLARSI